jgi:hypothetical protein
MTADLELDGENLPGREGRSAISACRALIREPATTNAISVCGGQLVFG